jgi:hypothetical protein
MSLKGPAITHSDNLNPWQWKSERAPRHKNTAPLAIQTENTFETGDCKETEYVLVPLNSVDKLKGYVPVDKLTVKRILEQAPNAQGALNVQDRAEARVTSAPVLQPLTKATELIQTEPAKCSQNSGPALVPVSAPDKLEGYEPKYFLKEDGKDDVS